jgi:hypothetical protein
MRKQDDSATEESRPKLYALLPGLSAETRAKNTGKPAPFKDDVLNQLLAIYRDLLRLRSQIISVTLLQRRNYFALIHAINHKKMPWLSIRVNASPEQDAIKRSRA